MEDIYIDNQNINDNGLERQYSFLNTKMKPTENSTNYKYLTFSASAGKTFDKSLRNIFKYIRLYNNNQK